MARIGVDARSLSYPSSGIGRCLDSLLTRMIPLEHEWVLYSYQPLRHSFVDFGNVTASISRWPSQLHPAWSQLGLPGLLDNDGIDLLWSPAHQLPLLSPARVRHLLTINDLTWRFYPETMTRVGRLADRWLMPPSVRRADRIVAISASTARDLVAEIPAAGNKVSVVRLAGSGSTDIDNSILARHGINFPFVLAVGTLEPRKNLPRLLEAFSRLRGDSRQQFGLVLAGGKGWGNDDIGMLSRQYGRSFQVRLLGHVTDPELAALYGAATVFAMPSLYEGFGLPLLEAMTHGVAVLTSSVSAMPEVAGNAAVLVDPLNIDAIRDGLQRLIDEPSLRHDLGTKGRRRAAEFSWDRAAAETMSALNMALAK